MSEPIAKTSPASVPGVPAGTTPVAPVANAPSPGADAGLAVPPAPSPVKFGGNPTGRTRHDGLKSGSPEALEADRKKNAERMRLVREKTAAEKVPPPLPSAVPGAAGEGATRIAVADGFIDVASVGWTAEDFKQVAPSTIELVEQWRVSAAIDLAEEGKLTGSVVKKIASDAAFPGPAKRSLQDTSPAALAKLFNTLNVPTAMKAYITTCPTILFLIVRDFQNRSEIRKLIEMQAAHSRETKPEEKKP